MSKQRGTWRLSDGQLEYSGFDREKNRTRSARERKYTYKYQYRYVPQIYFPNHRLEKKVRADARARGLSASAYIALMISKYFGIEHAPESGESQLQPQGSIRVYLPKKLLSKVEYYARDRGLTVPRAMLELIKVSP